MLKHDFSREVVRHRKSLAAIGSVLLVTLASFDGLATGADKTTLPVKQSRPTRAMPSRIRGERAKSKLPTAEPPEWDSATLEVFFADPRKHLGPGGPRESAVATSKIATPLDTTSDSSKKHVGTWSKLISRDTIEDEVKSQLAAINEVVASPGNFKSGGFEAARVHFTVLAALFGIAAEFDGDIRWKEHAPGWSELFGRAGKNCKAGSDAAFKEAKLRAADLAELVRGGDPDPVGAGGNPQTWPERVDRRPLMSRLELSQQERIGRFTANAAEFRRQQDPLKHEAELLAAVAEIIQRDGNEFAEDEGYRDYALELQKNAVELGSAAEQGNYEKARAAASAVNQSCDKCHADFRS